MTGLAFIVAVVLALVGGVAGGALFPVYRTALRMRDTRLSVYAAVLALTVFACFWGLAALFGAV